MKEEMDRFDHINIFKIVHPKDTKAIAGVVSTVLSASGKGREPLLSIST